MMEGITESNHLGGKKNQGDVITISRFDNVNKNQHTEYWYSYSSYHKDAEIYILFALNNDAIQNNI